MPLFSFYPYRTDGSSTGFEVRDCLDDARATIIAQQVLQEHASSVEVVIWQGERRVGAVSRVTDPA